MFWGVPYYWIEFSRLPFCGVVIERWWLTRIHPTCKYFNTATTNLVKRSREADELEIFTLTISHCSSEQHYIKTSALRLVSAFKDIALVLDVLILALTVTPPNFRMSTTWYFKIIPFQDNVIGREGLTQLITRQNDFLHLIWRLMVDGMMHYLSGKLQDAHM